VLVAAERLVLTRFGIDMTGAGGNDVRSISKSDPHLLGRGAKSQIPNSCPTPADIAVSTGLSTDVDARVLDTQGHPIHGLYACGNDMASVMAGAYPGPGTTLGPAVVFAYRAAMHACGTRP